MSLVEEKIKGVPAVAHTIRNNKIIGTVSYDSNDTSKVDLLELYDNPGECYFPALTDFETTDQVDRFFLSGPSGCGKSTWIRNLIHVFGLKYKKGRVCLFSNKERDDVLDDVVERMPVDDATIMGGVYTMDYLSSRSKVTLVIFDDIEDFTGKVRKEVERLRNECFRCGRSYGIYTVGVQHDPIGGWQTKTQIYEASHIVVFPARAKRDTYNKLYDKLKVPMDIVTYIKSHSSPPRAANYVCFRTQFPYCVISDKYVICDCN